MTEPDYTAERFKCYDCGHRGEAVKKYSTEYHGDGATEELVELICERCHGWNVYECDSEEGL